MIKQIYIFQITGYPLATYTGESSYLTLSLELAICAVFYWKKFKANPVTHVGQPYSKKIYSSPMQAWSS